MEPPAFDRTAPPPEPAPHSLDFISSPELFQDLSESELRELAGEFERVHVRSGETLIRQGDPADCMYLLVTGRLRAYVEREGTETVVGDIGRGEVVGEMALLIDEPRSATIRAVRDSELLRLSHAAFDRFIAVHPHALKRIARVNLLRLRRSIHSSRVETTVSTIALVPAGRGAPLSEFAASLVAALATFGPTLHLNRSRFESAVEKAGSHTAAPSTNVTGWLNEQESKYQYIVYESDETASEWTRRCVRQADHVLAIGMAGTDPSLGEVEAALQSGPERARARRELVLLHPPGVTRPSGTLAWLAPREVDGHHHVRLGCTGDYERIARFLTGRAVALVLGGGGARGVAHVGVIRAIQERGIPIDFVGGTSIGAVAGGALAVGLTCEGMVDVVRRLAATRLLDFTLPLVSLVAGRRIARVLHRMYGDVRIEDLWLNYFCVSTNLTRARPVVHRQGLLRKAVRASVSLPGILPPVHHDGDLLVDGGLMNRLPVDVIRRLCTGRVVAVSVSAPTGLEGSQTPGEHLSGWAVLFRRLRSRSKPDAPNIASILLWSTLVNGAQAQGPLERQADLCIQVPNAPVGLFDFKSIDSLIEAGYNAAVERLKQWPPSSPRSLPVRPLAHSHDQSLACGSRHTPQMRGPFGI